MIAALLGLPRWAQALGGAALLIGLFLLWDWWDDRQAIAAHEAQVQAQAAARASQAANDAGAAISESKNEVEQANENARAAAARNPDDPLRAGLDRLRADRPAPAPTR